MMRTFDQRRRYERISRKQAEDKRAKIWGYVWFAVGAAVLAFILFGPEVW